jgi:hypothetical protein
MRACLSLVVHEWIVAQASADKRMIVEIGQSYVRSIR